MYAYNLDFSIVGKLFRTDSPKYFNFEPDCKGTD